MEICANNREIINIKEIERILPHMFMIGVLIGEAHAHIALVWRGHKLLLGWQEHLSTCPGLGDLSCRGVLRQALVILAPRAAEL